MKKGFLVLFLCCLFVGLLAPAAGFAAAAKTADDRANSFNMEVRYWKPTGPIKVQKGEYGSEVDLMNALGLSASYVPYISLNWLNKDGRRFTAGYTGVSFAGDRTIDRSFTFGGKTFAVNDKVITDFDVSVYRLEYAVPFRKNGNEYFIYGIRGYSLRENLRDTTLGISSSEQLFIPSPSLGLGFNTPVNKKLDLFGEVAGISAGSLGFVLDLEAGIRYKFSSNIFATLGYKHLNIRYNANNSDDFADLGVNGPFFGLGYKF